MEIGAYGKTMKNLWNRIDVRLWSNEKGYSKYTLKPTYLSQELFDNDLVVIPKI